MRTILPIGFFVAGLAGLGFWAQAEHAPRIEAKLNQQATAAITDVSRHGLTVSVEGRDATLSGLSHSEEERVEIAARLKEIDGIRLIHDQTDLLTLSAPYGFTAEKSETAMQIAGVAPDEDTQARLLDELSKGAEISISLAAGEPDDNWSNALVTAMGGLELLESGTLGVEDKVIRLAGRAPTQQSAELVDAIGAELPEGYAWVTDVTVQAKDLALTLTYDTNTGLRAAGDVPDTLAPTDIATALGISEIDASLVNGATGNQQDVLTAVASLRDWLPAVETGTIEITPAGVSVEAAAQSDIDVDQLRELVVASLGEDVAIDITTTTRSFDEGHERTNPLTGLTTSNSGGYWYPVIDFTPSEEACGAELTKLRDQIAFAGDSADFTATAPPVLSAMTMTIVTCLFDDDLQVEVTAAADLSNEAAGARQQALIDGLVNRGVPADRIAMAASDADKGTRTDLRWIYKAADAATTEE